MSSIRLCTSKRSFVIIPTRLVGRTHKLATVHYITTPTYWVVWILPAAEAVIKSKPHNHVKSSSPSRRVLTLHNLLHWWCCHRPFKLLEVNNAACFCTTQFSLHLLTSTFYKAAAAALQSHVRILLHRRLGYNQIWRISFFCVCVDLFSNMVCQSWTCQPLIVDDLKTNLFDLNEGSGGGRFHNEA